MIVISVISMILHKQARDLLQEQQHYFQYEQEIFYESMKHEYDKLHYQLNHYMEVSKQIIRQNTKLRDENSKLKNALQFTKTGGHYYLLNTSGKKSLSSTTNSKHKKEFRKWYKQEIGEDFMEYLELFKDAGFDDLRTIRHINHEQELIDLGIEKRGHRLLILDKIENYRLQYHQQNQDDVALPAFQQCSSSPVNKSQHHNMNNPLLLNDSISGDGDHIEGSLKTE